MRDLIQEIRELQIESAKSDKYEVDVAASINAIKGVTAERPKVSTAYADVLLTLDSGHHTWLEVKMSHTDNLSNPRMFYNGKKWVTSYKTSAAKVAVELLNKSAQTKKFIKSIAEFSKIAKPEVPTNKGGLNNTNAVPLQVMKAYFEQDSVNRYILNVENYDLGAVVTDHYINGKAEPAEYMQAGDDFYLIGKTNPFKLPKNIPVLSGKGNFRVRVSTRSAFYEVQAEIKIAEMPKSKYSLMPGTTKLNPFAKL